MITKITKLGVSSLMLILLSASCYAEDKKRDNHTSDGIETIINNGLKFSESTYPYKRGLLIANFGSSELNPLNSEGKGYISYYKNKKASILIATDGNLNAPKGMIEKDGLLYICDVNKVVIYDLKKPGSEPKTIKFKNGELFLNDIARLGNDLFVSVTNTGNIYKIDITNPATIESSLPTLWSNVTGANGLLVDGNKMYVASYPADGVTTENNVVYVIADISAPSPEKLIQKEGQYDGLALSKATNLVGPADISINNNTLFIPDLVSSKVIIKDISKEL